MIVALDVHRDRYTSLIKTDRAMDLEAEIKLTTKMDKITSVLDKIKTKLRQGICSYL